MSVINTMLKDLERRGVDGSATGDKILGGLSSNGNKHQDSGSSSKAYLLGLISAIVVVVIVVGGYYVSPYKLVTSADNNVKPVVAHANHVVATGNEQHAQQTSPEPAISNATVAVQAKTSQDKAVVSDSRPVQPDETTSALQKTSLPPSVPVVAAKAAGVVKRDAPAVASREKIITEPVVKSTAESESTQPVAEDDAKETTAESLRVVTKQQRAFTPAEKSRQAYATAVTMYNQGRKQEAKSSLTQALALDPGNADACRLLTVVYLEDGRADLAAETIEAGLKLHDKDQNLLRLYVQALVKQKKYSQAIVVMGRRIELTSPEDLGYMAGLYQKNNDHIEAVKYYAQALQLVPSKSVWWLGQGISLEILKQYKEAIQSYQKSVSTGELSTNLMEYAINRMNVIKQHHPDLKS